MDKEKIKKELLEGSNDILTRYGEYELVDGISVMNMASKTVFLGSLRVHNEDNVENIKNDLKKQFNNYGELTIREQKVFPCCAPNYIHVSFNISITG